MTVMCGCVVVWLGIIVTRSIYCSNPFNWSARHEKKGWEHFCDSALAQNIMCFDGLSLDSSRADLDVRDIHYDDFFCAHHDVKNFEAPKLNDSDSCRRVPTVLCYARPAL
jgi:hypothetical protein